MKERKHDCSKCEGKCPELNRKNKAVWFLWTKINTQWRAGGFSIVGLDFPAVFQIADVYGIEMTRATFEKLKALESKELSRMREKKEGGENNKKRSPNNH